MAALVREASRQNLSIRVAGSGHSFTPIVATSGLLLSLKNMQGLVSADLDRKRVVVRAGTRIGDIGRALKQIGLSLANQGDIDTQAIAVALLTGTHGTGIGLGCLSSQAVGMRARARAASRQASRRLTKTGPIANAAAFSHSVGRIEPIGRALTNVRSTSAPAVRCCVNSCRGERVKPSVATLQAVGLGLLRCVPNQRPCALAALRGS